MAEELIRLESAPSVPKGKKKAKKKKRGAGVESAAPLNVNLGELATPKVAAVQAGALRSEETVRHRPDPCLLPLTHSSGIVSRTPSGLCLRCCAGAFRHTKFYPF